MDGILSYIVALLIYVILLVISTVRYNKLKEEEKKE